MQHSNRSTNVTCHSEIAVDLPIYSQTKTSVTVQLDKMWPTEAEVVRAMLNAVITEGLTYPQAAPLTPEEFDSYWLTGDAFVVRLCQEADSVATPTSTIVGAFYIKPNFPGRCSHICNAGFIVTPEVRGQGIGRLMGEAMLELARDRGYRAVMYNLVFKTNLPSLKLWETLGFEQIGRIPEAAHLPDGRYVDVMMLYRALI
ncbi:MAG: GNAT family N-acetyltransferase [Leptolyngbya sp. SIO1D8]|nr:GNAT family N-acetyltransferase [Leptolyngbya sp. SIO1D8]